MSFAYWYKLPNKYRIVEVILQLVHRRLQVDQITQRPSITSLSPLVHSHALHLPTLAVGKKQSLPFYSN